MTHIILLSIASLFFYQEEDIKELTIVISNITEHTGYVKVAIFNNKEDHLKDSFRSGKFEVTDENTLKCSFDIPYGEYSFAIYQDVDSNGELNSNFIGIPSEPYAFSNNASIMFGPPSYEKSKFTFNKTHLVAQVKLK